MTKKAKTDPVREFQKQAVDQRVCLFYVADRVKGILENSKTGDKLRYHLEEFRFTFLSHDQSGQGLTF